MKVQPKPQDVLVFQRGEAGPDIFQRYMLGEHSLVEGRDFVLYTHHEPLLDWVTPGCPQLIVMGSLDDDHPVAIIGFVRQLRRMNPKVRIVYLSGIEAGQPDLFDRCIHKDGQYLEEVAKEIRSFRIGQLCAVW